MMMKGNEMTPNQLPNAAQIASMLTAEEWKALEYIQTHGHYLINNEDEPLTNFDRVFLKGLLNKIYNQDRSRYFLNVYGKSVLAARQSDKPTVISEDFVNPIRAYEETFTRDELLERLDISARIIHEFYTGKHDVIPHPAEVYQAGLWEIYKVDEHQSSAERVGDIGELKQLRDEVTVLRKENASYFAALVRLRDYDDSNNFDEGDTIRWLQAVAKEALAAEGEG